MSFSIEVKLNESFHRKVSQTAYQTIENVTLNKCAENCLNYIRTEGTGKKHPSGGAPIFHAKEYVEFDKIRYENGEIDRVFEEFERTTIFPSYLLTSHYVDNATKNIKYIRSYASYWQNVVNGTRPRTTPYGYQYPEGVENYVPNPYNKRAVDNLIKTGYIPKMFKQQLNGLKMI